MVARLGIDQDDCSEFAGYGRTLFACIVLDRDVVRAGVVIDKDQFFAYRSAITPRSVELPDREAGERGAS